MIVLDANILVRAVLGRRVRQILDVYQLLGISFLAPEPAFDDAEKYAIVQAQKRGQSVAIAHQTLSYFSGIVAMVPEDVDGPFEQDARTRLCARDEDDWPILASALALKCDIWTKDADFFWYWRCDVDDKSR